MKIATTKQLLALLTTSVVFLLFYSFLFSHSKIAYVDSAKLMNGYSNGPGSDGI
jgi:hypothetical protein